MRKGQLAVCIRTHGPHKHRAAKDERAMFLLRLVVIEEEKKISNNSPFIQFMSNENGSSLILQSKYLQRCKDGVGTRCLGETISNRSENRTWVAHLERTAFGLNTSICDLAVVDHHGITTSAARGSISPADALGELCVRIGQEELHTISTVQ